MKKRLYILALLVSHTVAAADISRCGRDQFGNVVCMDKDGVLSTRPETKLGSGKETAASGVSAAEAKARRDTTEELLRCGFDPFGNKVCR